ncbi:sodium channel, voltage-gated, type X, alpha subunit [Cichlidogyrus casuarinus]|uniref:Sodium channel, voltage-gated, type X, alpha subunit n=1 Tax=Cichlidogyrus casuarinus TaxID=1844966 RepID=A0ABD2PK80_9PLAT
MAVYISGVLFCSRYIFTAFYTSEVVLKALARGLIMTNFTMLRDSWNWMDVSVITLASVFSYRF